MTNDNSQPERPERKPFYNSETYWRMYRYAPYVVRRACAPPKNPDRKLSKREIELRCGYRGT